MATPRRQKQRVKRENSKKVDVVIVKESCLVQGSFCLQRKGALYVKANGESKYFEGEGNSNARWEQDLLHWKDYGGSKRRERNLYNACEIHLNMIIYS